MNREQPSYIAFATHPSLRDGYVAGKAMLVVKADDNSIVWTNAAGVQFFGQKNINHSFAASKTVLFRQFTAAASRLTKPGERHTFTIHVTRRFRRCSTSATAQMFTMGAEVYTLFECNTEKQTSGSQQELVDGFRPEEAHLALTNALGEILAQSQGFARTELNKETLVKIIQSLSSGSERYVERLVTSESGIWPLALGRLSDTLFLLYISEELSSEIAEQLKNNATVENRNSHKDEQRSALDTIAAIDEGLSVLTYENISKEAPVSNPIIRKIPDVKQTDDDVAKSTEAHSTEPRHPVRFVWRTDAEGRLIEVSHELAEAVGEKASDIIGLRFEELETQRGVIGGNAIARLLENADTWSGRIVEWPIAGTLMQIPVDLAALPTYSREHQFKGFRGFGLARVNEETQRPPLDPAPLPETQKHVISTANQLTNNEREALNEIAQNLRSMSTQGDDTANQAAAPPHHLPLSKTSARILRKTAALPPASNNAAQIDTRDEAILIQSGNRIVHANPAFMTISGYGSLEAINAAGNPDSFVERGSNDELFLTTADGGQLLVSAHLQAIFWQGKRALALTVRQEYSQNDPLKMPRIASKPVATLSRQANEEAAELHAILETATDGIMILNADKHIRSLSTSASALFGVESATVENKLFSDLFADESHNDINHHLDRLLTGRADDVMHAGLEVIGRESGGGLIPLFVTLGRLPQSGAICAILRDITGWKRREDDLRTAKRDAIRAKDEREMFLKTLRYELRQPLDAIVSLSEAMNDKAFGPMGDNRYHATAREISTKGRQARKVIGRLLGEPVIEQPSPRAKPEPTQTALPQDHAMQVNDAIAEAVSLVQSRANARHIIIRAALSPTLIETSGDTEILKEIALELMQEAVQFTPAGGQVVVSTAITASGETVLRFRDNGISPSRRRDALSSGQQIENPRLTNARRLAEGLGGRFLIHAVPNEGMLVEIFLPTTNARSLHY